MQFNDLSTPLSLLTTRRSGRARDLTGPGPNANQLREMLAIAARTPDHGKLAPWRFVIVEEDARDAFAEQLIAAYRAERPNASAPEIATMDQFARYAPALVVVLHSPKESHIPRWEQELSTGAATMNLLHAAHAMGFAGSWITGWPAFSDAVRDLFGQEHERIAGFVYIGTPGAPLEERPRPDLKAVISTWSPKGPKGL